MPQKTPAPFGNHVCPAGLLLILFTAAALAQESEKPKKDSKPYLVVRVALDQAGADAEKYRAVARQIAEFHSGKTVDFDGQDFTALEKTLKEHAPQNVLFVIPPALLDVNFHRRVLLLCNRLDDDPFADFAFGYFTARDGAQLEKLWKRTLEVHKNGLANKTWVEAAVTRGTKSFSYAEMPPGITQAAGFQGPHHYFAESGSDPDVLQFVEKTLPDLEKAAVISLAGNGDPQGVWLFNDQRNADPAKHWAYAPDKVGQDPTGEMPRITAERFAKLKLQNPIVWSGTCHCAATCNVYVESDIVSTFGRTDKTTLYKLAPKESMGLALLDAGAVAFLAPVAANHGYSTLLEQEFALMNGATLGETLLATYNDVFLASNGNLKLHLFKEGDASFHNEPIMQGAGANRLLIGDPALAPFQPTANPAETIQIENRHKDGFDVLVTWQSGFQPRAWDIYGTDSQRDYRISARIPLDDLAPPGKLPKFSATITAKDEQGRSLPYVLKHAVAEEYHGKRYLHLQANINRQAAQENMRHKLVKAVFTVKLD